MTIQPCIPHVQSHTWGLAVGGSVCTLNGLHFGSLAEALEDVSHFVEVIPARRFRMLPAVVKGKRKMVKVFDPPFRHVLHPATWMLGQRIYAQGLGKDSESTSLPLPSAQSPLGIVAQATGLRRLSETSGWHMCAPNAVLHPQMGPAVTMATDGVHCILWSKPWPEAAEWMMAHVSNITGPVTSTPTALWEWCKGAKPTGASAQGVGSKSSPIALALEQLRKALAGCQTAAQPMI